MTLLQQLLPHRRQHQRAWLFGFCFLLHSKGIPSLTLNTASYARTTDHPLEEEMVTPAVTVGHTGRLTTAASYSVHILSAISADRLLHMKCDRVKFPNVVATDDARHGGGATCIKIGRA